MTLVARRASLLVCLPLALVAASPPQSMAQQSATRVHDLVLGLTVTPRVLIIGASPTDAPAELIAWLARGHRVQTAYVSLSRGESAANHTGMESGIALGAIHVEEVLAARRIDGGEQFFTRAYDIGGVRSADEAFTQWDRDSVLADLVITVRAFRPHVIISTAALDTASREGQAQAVAWLSRLLLAAASDTARFRTSSFGLPWEPTRLYEPGRGVTIDVGAHDVLRGASWADIGAESRSRLRSFGFEHLPWSETAAVSLRLVASRGEDDGTVSRDTMLLGGTDTSLARLRGPADWNRFLPQLVASADSAQRLLDLRNPGAIVRYLGRFSEIAEMVRKAVPACRHPSRDLALVMGTRLQRCNPDWLDLDASIDLMQRRASDAVLAASGVSIVAEADREFLASGDTARVTVTVRNDGDVEIDLNDVTVSGALPARMTELVRVPAHGVARLARRVVSLAIAQPWWVYKPMLNLYPRITIPLDGAPRAGLMLKDFSIDAAAVPETMMRPSDVTATVTVAGSTVSASVGFIAFRVADPALGVQTRGTSGVPAVTLGFERSLEWARAGKPLTNTLRLALKSYSDRSQAFSMKAILVRGAGVGVEALPPTATLLPREWRELRLRLTGRVPQGRYELTVAGQSATERFESGFRTAQYAYLPPVHLYRDAAVRVQTVEIQIPERLSVAWVKGTGDDPTGALKQLDVPAVSFDEETLLRLDIGGVSTIAIAPGAYQLHPNLYGQSPRLLEFVRRGGTLLIFGNPRAAMTPGVLPFPVAFSAPYAERVGAEDAAITPIAQRASALAWPNAIGARDWDGWIDERATTVPTTADPRYASVIEVHDAGAPENRNSVLIASVGKGKMVYASLSLPQQIANGVPGAMRLFINLLSAGLAK